MKKLKILRELKRFGQKGEKTGWTYIEIENELSEQLIPKRKTSYRVLLEIKGFEKTLELTTLPMGEGNFIIPFKVELLKKLRKKAGEKLEIQISYNADEYQIDKDLLEYLELEPKSKAYFESLTKANQNYFSKWIDSAKTPLTKANRIAESVQAFNKKMNFAEMLRARKR
ncbi:MAG: DUF1905 domain-containing protein [Saprospiraceae bacterium]|nr:DUF1905 domain-containing protein [Saprospiraceae bacterium]